MLKYGNLVLYYIFMAYLDLFDFNLMHLCQCQAGGRNTALIDAVQRRIPLLTDYPTIIFGADVTHPAPGEDTSPSIAAVINFLTG